MGDRSEVFPFFIPAGWNRHSRSFCTILFRQADGACNFSRHLPVNVVHAHSQFFFLFLYLFVQNGICACTSDAKALGGFSRNTSRFLWQKQKPEFRYGTSTKREIPPPPTPPKKKNCQRMYENEMQTRLCALKTFPLDAECFRNF